MPVYCKTESGWKLGLLMWEKRTAGWTMVNPLYVKKTETAWEALPFGTMLASAVTSPASGYVLKAGSTIGVSVSAISSSGFADAGVGTQIQIATDAGFANIVSAYDGAYTTSWTSAALGTVTTYYVRARHRGANLGWGPWSAYAWFSVAAAMGTVGFSASTTWTAPYDGWYTIFACGGGGGGGASGESVVNRGQKSGYAGGDSSVWTTSGSSVSIFASGGAGGGSGSYISTDGDGYSDSSNGEKGTGSSWYSGGSAGNFKGQEPTAGGNGGGGTGSSPYGIGGAGGITKGYEYGNGGSNGGRGGNGGTTSSEVWLARGTVLQIVIGGGGSGGGTSDLHYTYKGKAGSAGVVYITG